MTTGSALVIVVGTLLWAAGTAGAGMLPDPEALVCGVVAIGGGVHGDRWVGDAMSGPARAVAALVAVLNGAADAQNGAVEPRTGVGEGSRTVEGADGALVGESVEPEVWRVDRPGNPMHTTWHRSEDEADAAATKAVRDGAKQVVYWRMR